MSKTFSFSKPVKRQTLAEQMAASIEDAILAGELAPDVALPTEPELAEQFGVSRAVVRDATRILMARGLVEVQHGRGVFVTRSQSEAFGRALLLALRRANATVWDVEQFEQLLLPEAVALAAQVCTDQELDDIRQMTGRYMTFLRDHYSRWWGKDAPAGALEEMQSGFRRILEAILVATHNQLFQQLAPTLLELRSLRQWEQGEETAEGAWRREAAFVNAVVDAVASRDPATARATMQNLMRLPPAAVEVMQNTPIGEIPVIPIPLPELGA